MKISFSILIYDGLAYSKENPGIAIADYADFLGWTEERTEEFWDKVSRHFAEKSHTDFCYSTEQTTTVGDIINEIMLRMKLDCEAVSSTVTQTYIFAQNEFVQILSPETSIGDIEKYYELEDSLQVFLVLSNQAGTIWNNDGLRYYMNSKETGSHHIPHVHVDYKNESTASISLINGEVLVGKLPSKILKKAKKQVTDNREFLLQCWEKYTDGFRVNINHSFGITPLKASRQKKAL